jgi:hypothetical protein
MQEEFSGICGGSRKGFSGRGKESSFISLITAGDHMRFFRRLLRIGLLVIIFALPCFFIYQELWTTPISAAAQAEKKAELQEQLGRELRNYYLGADNWRECQRLINKIEKMD